MRTVASRPSPFFICLTAAALGYVLPLTRSPKSYNHLSFPNFLALFRNGIDRMSLNRITPPLSAFLSNLKASSRRVVSSTLPPHWSIFEFCHTWDQPSAS